MDYSDKIKKILEEMQILMTGLDPIWTQWPTSLESIPDILEGILELLATKVLQGLSLSTTLRTNKGSFGLRKLAHLSFDARSRLKTMLETIVQVVKVTFAFIQAPKLAPPLQSRPAPMLPPLSVRPKHVQVISQPILAPSSVLPLVPGPSTIQILPTSSFATTLATSSKPLYEHAQEILKSPNPQNMYLTKLLKKNVVAFVAGWLALLAPQQQKAPPRRQHAVPIEEVKEFEEDSMETTASDSDTDDGYGFGIKMESELESK